MKTPKLTPWFPPSVRPVHAGIYETRWANPKRRTSYPLYQHWDGLVWSGWSSNVDMAERNAGLVSVRQEPQWRGLAEQPK